MTQHVFIPEKKVENLLSLRSRHDVDNVFYVREEIDEKVTILEEIVFIVRFPGQDGWNRLFIIL